MPNPLAKPTLIGESDARAAMMGATRAPNPALEVAKQPPSAKKKPPVRGKKKKGKRPPPAQAMYGE